MPGVAFEELVARLSVEGAEKLKAQINAADDSFLQVEKTVEKTGKAMASTAEKTEKTASAAVTAGRNFSTAKVPILNVALALTATAYAAERVGKGLYQGSGTAIAAKLQGAQFTLAKIGGSADIAAGGMAMFRKEAADSPFREDAADLAEYARALIATGDNAEQAARSVGIFQDVAAAAGDATMTGKLAEIMGKVRSEPHAAVKQLLNFDVKGVNLQKILELGGGIKTKNSEQASEVLGSMYGPKAGEIIMRGLELAFKGSAMERVKNTFTGAMNSMVNKALMIMEPTGEKLLVLLTPVMRILDAAVSLVEAGNRATGGLLGLAFAGYGLVRMSALLVGSLTAAQQGVAGLTARLYGLAGATTVGGMGGTAQILGPISNLGGFRQAFGAGGVRGGAAFLGARIPGFLANFMRGPGPWMLGGLAASLVGDRVGGRTGNMISSIGGGIALGAGIGSMFGGVGAAPGAAIGAVGGLLKGIYDDMHQSKTAEQRIADNTDKMADYLAELRGQMIGGKDRAHRIMGQLESEYTLQRMLMRGGGYA